MAALADPKPSVRRLPNEGRPRFFCRARRRGQAMVETLIVLLFLMAAFFLFYDFAYASVARLLLANGASRAARSDTVGYNEFQRTKALRVGMIPVAGKRLVPDGGRRVENAYSELGLIRSYLQAEEWADADGILDYERWHGLTHSVDSDGDRRVVTATFEVPQLLPHKLAAFFGYLPTRDVQRLKSVWEIEDHASYYLTR